MVGPLAVLLLLLATGCQSSSAPSTPPDSDEMDTLAPSAATAVYTIPRQTRTSLPTAATMEPTAPSIIRAPTPVVTVGPGPIYEVVFSIQLGQDGIQYRGLDVPDMEITGPNNLAVLGDGSFVLSDLIGNRLLWYSREGQFLREVDLYSLDILNVSNLRATDDELLVLEISFGVSPERYRIARLSASGDLLARYDLPHGLHLEDGLSGIGVGCNGEIFVELEGGARIYSLTETDGEYRFQFSPEGYTCEGRNYQMLLGSLAVLGDARVETGLTYRMGGLLLLQVNRDGSTYLIRDDVVTEPVITVDRTVHFMDARGRQIAVAREPIDERLYYVPGELAVGPDGEVYHLIPRREQLDIVRLNFYESLDPLIPGAQPPIVITLGEAP